MGPEDTDLGITEPQVERTSREGLAGEGNNLPKNVNFLDIRDLTNGLEEMDNQYRNGGNNLMSAYQKSMQRHTQAQRNTSKTGEI